MTTDTAAQAAIGAAAHELHLPTVRAEATASRRSPPENTSPTWGSSPRSCPPRSTTAPTVAVPGASTRPSSPG